LTTRRSEIRAFQT